MNTLFYVLEHESTAGAGASPKLYDMEYIYNVAIIYIGAESGK